MPSILSPNTNLFDSRMPKVNMDQENSKKSALLLDNIGHRDSFREKLMEQLRDYELKNLQETFSKATSQFSSNDCSIFTPILENEVIYTDGTTSSPASSLFWDIGLEEIRNNKVAVVTLAGGQGTRLGSNLPKGLFDIGLPSHKSLFKLQAERILSLQRLADQGCPHSKCHINWYIMTSNPTHLDTITYFEKENYFGLDIANLVFFQQGELPCFDFEGRILLADENNIAFAPDGNGGIYTALIRQGILADMSNRGIKHIHIYCVDNALVRVADPLFIGMCHQQQAKVGVKVVIKKNPLEPVGVLCHISKKSPSKKDISRYTVLEYSEMDPALANQRLHDDPQTLTFRFGNIANHYFNLSYLETLCVEVNNELTYHVAKKKITHFDPRIGKIIKPEVANGVKLELFIFDVLQYVEKGLVVCCVERNVEFSPLKNANGPDSPATSSRQLMDLHIRWLLDAGWIPSPSQRDTLSDLSCEISPLISYGGEGLPNLSGVSLKFPLYVSNLGDLMM